MNKEFIETLKNAKKLAIITHLNPDGDAFGSSLMFYEMLSKNFPKVEKDIFTETDSISDIFNKMLNGIVINPSSIVENQETFEYYDTVVCLDCSTLNRFSKYAKIFDSAIASVNIDHHKDNENYAKINIVEPTSSCCETLYTLFKDCKLNFNQKMLKYCYTGMATDTLNFSIQSVTAQTHRILADIKDAEIDIHKISNMFFGGYDINKYNLLNLARKNAELWFDGKIIFSHLSLKDFKKCQTNENDTVGLINGIFQLKEALICILVTPRNNHLHISFRSVPGVDVSIIANYFGGGGHTCASATDTNLSLKNLKNELKNLVYQQIIEYKKDFSNYFAE